MVAFLLFKRSPDSTAVDQAAADYAEGLNLLLEGNREVALKKLKEAVSKDSNNVDAYLKIGDILREMGQIERAINVHKYLTVRSGLTFKQRSDILWSLTKDYESAKEYDKALGVVNKVLAEDKNMRWAKEMKVQLHEQKEEWENAFQAYKQLHKKNGRKSGRLALYRVQQGMQFIENGHEKEAQNCFRDAIKIDPTTPPAYIYLADSYRRESRKRDALKVLKEFVERVPNQSYLAFERIQQLLYEGGVFGEIENLYLDIIRTQPNNLMARLALIEIYEKKGEIEKAIDTSLEVLEQEPTNKQAKKYLVKLYHKTGANDKAVQEALDIIEQSLKQKEFFKCKLCGYESEEPFWRCPECLEWETSIRN
ncbi:tetratricopeptide repeat protein [candidate division KSB1 bacterium]|nr:tetratricopeptide repeat protein [candidate division KSB1 bacterium]